MKSMKIKSRLVFLSSIFCIAFIILALCSNFIINKVKVNGSMYKQIILQKDLVADILPPPEYIIEIHLISYQLLESNDSSKISTLITNQKALESTYEERHEYWLDNLEQGKTRDTFVVNSYDSAEKYFKVLNDDFIPAIQNGNTAAASKILNSELSPLYEEHLKYINQVVDLANTNSADIENNAANTISNNTILLTCIVIFSLLFVALLCMYIIRSITKPLSFLTNHLSLVSNKNLSKSIPAKMLKGKDELSLIAKATNDMQVSIKSMIMAIKEETRNINKSILSANDDIYELSAKTDDSATISSQLSEHISDVAASTEEITATTTELDKAVEDVSNRANDGAETAEEISSRALMLHEQATNSQKSINKTRQIIDESMEKAIEKSKSVERIQSLSQVIMDIANQTNLLALNASIEAARAGEYGKGFSVVASEIGTLSDNSKDTVSEIQKTITVVYESVEALVDASKETLKFIDTQIVSLYNELINTGDSYFKDANFIKDLVSNLSATSEELFASIRVVSESIETIASSSTESAKKSNDISDAVTIINQKAQKIKNDTVHMKASSEKLNTMIMEFIL